MTGMSPFFQTLRNVQMTALTLVDVPPFAWPFMLCGPFRLCAQTDMDYPFYQDATLKYSVHIDCDSGGILTLFGNSPLSSDGFTDS